jgi:hypothetical protein
MRPDVLMSQDPGILCPSTHVVPFFPGLKRHFHAKHAEGLLSSRGLRSLDWCCDSALDEPDKPLDLWERVEAEVKRPVYMWPCACQLTCCCPVLGPLFGCSSLTVHTMCFCLECS